MSFTDAIETKYGEGKLQTEEKEVTCTSIYGESRHMEKTYRTTWNSADTKVMHYLSSYRDSKCKEQYLSYFLFEDIAKAKLLTDCNNKEREKLQEKKKLSDF